MVLLVWSLALSLFVPVEVTSFLFLDLIWVICGGYGVWSCVGMFGLCKTEITAKLSLFGNFPCLGWYFWGFVVCDFEFVF